MNHSETDVRNIGKYIVWFRNRLFLERILRLVNGEEYAVQVRTGSSYMYHLVHPTEIIFMVDKLEQLPKLYRIAFL